MFIYVQASDYDRFLRLEVEPDELVRSVKAKINQELGGNVPEEVIDTLNYVGITLDCSTPLRNYGIEESSLLYIGRNPHAPYAPAPATGLTPAASLTQQQPHSQPQTLSQQPPPQPQYQQQPTVAAAYQPYQQAAYQQAAAYPQAAQAYYGYGYPSY